MIIDNNKSKYTTENDHNNRFLINKTDINLALNENKKVIIFKLTIEMIIDHLIQKLKKIL